MEQRMLEARDFIRQNIEANQSRYIQIADRIWTYAELGLREHRSARLLMEELKAAGFRVTVGLSGMETAFLAEYGEGGPVLAMVAEYDALPGLGQEAGCPQRRPTAENTFGHGCGHNVMGTAVLAAAAGLKAYMEAHALPGTLRVIGTPAEETVGAKAYLVRDGLFSDVDACIGVHSAWFNAVQNYGMPACRTIRFRFAGKAAHAGVAPHLGRSALDACELMSVGVNYLRDHVRPSVRMSYCYEDAGGLADNVVPASACVRYGLRAENAGELLDVSQRVTDIARGAALMTGTRLDVVPVMAMSDFTRNDTLGRACAEAMSMVGGPDFDASDEALAREFFDIAEPEEIAASITQLCLCDPEGERFRGSPLIRDVAPYQPTRGAIGGGSDIGDVTYVTPTAHFLIAACALGTPYHSWRMTAQSGSSIAHKGMLFGAKAMALAGVRMLLDPPLLQEARAELLRRTGGSRFLCCMKIKGQGCHRKENGNMTKQEENALRELQDSVKHITALSSLANLLQWDLRTGAPGKSLQAHSAWMARLSEENRRIIASERMAEILDLLSQTQGLSPADAAMIREAKRAHARKRNVPPERLRASVTAISASEAAWAEARKHGDWESFRPHLSEVIAFERELAGYYDGAKAPYDALLDQYEPGCTTAILDPLFARLGEAMTGLLARIRGTERRIDKSFLRGAYPEAARRDFILRLLSELGFDFEAGRLDRSAHPFTTCCGAGDVRITAAYPADELSFTLFAAIHEGGHGIYEQNTPQQMKDRGLGGELSMGLHESQSRFYENIIGRSRAFWKYFYPALQSAFPALSGVGAEEFYRGINAVEPGLLRTAADEVTYNLHIIIRYELEKALISGDLSVGDLPGAWNEKYRAYLGVSPAHHGEGVLQDTHWAAGVVGYFPSYALGNLYSAQIAARMGERLGNLESLLERGELLPIRQWLTEHIYRCGGMYPPAELIERVTGKAPGAETFIGYLEGKYGDIYGF